MATTTTPEQTSVLRRPMQTTGRWSWLTTVDHKKIGIMYFWTVLVFFTLGGFEAVFVRLQLGTAESALLTEEMYNQLFTMHGVTMVFLVVMPLSAAFFNYLLPLQIGARDVAFPRLNAFSYWVFLFGGIFLYSSFFLGGAPNGGWFGYAPLSTATPGHNMAFYAMGLQILGISSLAASVNFIVTILNMRAPGMTMMRMPVFVWMSLVVNFLLLFSLPIITVALIMLQFDIGAGTAFFQASAGGDPILWQHLFWLFGHPEVYILILPAMGIVSEVLPTFSRKPIFGYSFLVFAGAAIGFIGFGVWAHHMFTSAIGPVARASFGLTTMFIAVPTGIKIFNWVFTMIGGKLKFTTPMLFATGFITMFTIGGLSGVTHAIVPHDYQQTDTYWVVAHFHYVLFGGALFGLVAGIYYWFPKVTGRLMSEKLGRLHFWTWFIGFNLTFGPMHMSGLLGQPRRTAVLPAGLGGTVELYNLLSTIGALVLVVSASIFLWNLIASIRGGEVVGHDPWDARTLEWMTTSPPAEHNFDEIPVVEHRDEWWYRKYAEDEAGVPRRIPAGGSDDGVASGGDQDASVDEGRKQDASDDQAATGGDALVTGTVEPAPADTAAAAPADTAAAAPADAHSLGIHMPDPSYWPVFMTLGFLPFGYGVVYKSVPLLVLGVLWMFVGFYGWIIEPVAEGDDD